MVVRRRTGASSASRYSVNTVKDVTVGTILVELEDRTARVIEELLTGVTNVFTPDPNRARADEIVLQWNEGKFTVQAGAPLEEWLRQVHGYTTGAEHHPASQFVQAYDAFVSAGMITFKTIETTVPEVDLVPETPVTVTPVVVTIPESPVTQTVTKVKPSFPYGGVMAGLLMFGVIGSMFGRKKK